MELREDTPYIFSTLETTIALSQSTIEADVHISGSFHSSKDEAYKDETIGELVCHLSIEPKLSYGMCGEK